MAQLEEEIIKESEYKPYLWWRYIDDIFFLWEHGKNKLKSYINSIYGGGTLMTYFLYWNMVKINYNHL